MTAERIKALEVQQENSAEDMVEIKLDIGVIKQQVTEINRKLDSQKGYIAGAMSVIVLVGGAIAAVVVAAWDIVMQSLRDSFL